MPKPINAAHKMLKMISVRMIDVIEREEIALRKSVSKIAIPITATARLSSSKPPNFRAHDNARMSPEF